MSFRLLIIFLTIYHSSYSENSNENWREAFSKHMIVPDLIHVLPKNLLRVDFGSGPIEPGVVLPASSILKAPSIKWNHISGSEDLFSLFIVNLDVPNRRAPIEAEWQHMTVYNLKDNKLQDGDTAVEYSSKYQHPKKNGLQRIVLLVFKQKDRINTSEMTKWNSSTFRSKDGNSRGNFHIKMFAKARGFLEAIAGNFFYVSDSLQSHQNTSCESISDCKQSFRCLKETCVPVVRKKSSLLKRSLDESITPKLKGKMGKVTNKESNNKVKDLRDFLGQYKYPSLCKQSILGNCSYLARWFSTNISEEILFVIQTRGRGLTGIGFNYENKLHGSDFVLGRKKDNSIQDSFITKSNGIKKDKDDNLTDKESSMRNKIWEIRFKRKLTSSNHGEDVDLSNKKGVFIFVPRFVHSEDKLQAKEVIFSHVPYNFKIVYKKNQAKKKANPVTTPSPEDSRESVSFPTTDGTLDDDEESGDIHSQNAEESETEKEDKEDYEKSIYNSEGSPDEEGDGETNLEDPKQSKVESVEKEDYDKSFDSTEDSADEKNSVDSFESSEGSGDDTGSGGQSSENPAVSKVEDNDLHESDNDSLSKESSEPSEGDTLSQTTTAEEKYKGSYSEEDKQDGEEEEDSTDTKTAENSAHENFEEEDANGSSSESSLDKSKNLTRNTITESQKNIKVSEEESSSVEENQEFERSLLPGETENISNEDSKDLDGSSNDEHKNNGNKDANQSKDNEDTKKENSEENDHIISSKQLGKQSTISLNNNTRDDKLPDLDDFIDEDETESTNPPTQRDPPKVVDTELNELVRHAKREGSFSGHQDGLEILGNKEKEQGGGHGEKSEKTTTLLENNTESSDPNIVFDSSGDLHKSEPEEGSGNAKEGNSNNESTDHDGHSTQTSGKIDPAQSADPHGQKDIEAFDQDPVGDYGLQDNFNDATINENDQVVDPNLTTSNDVNIIGGSSDSVVNNNKTFKQSTLENSSENDHFIRHVQSETTEEVIKYPTHCRHLDCDIKLTWHVYKPAGFITFRLFCPKENHNSKIKCGIGFNHKNELKNSDFVEYSGSEIIDSHVDENGLLIRDNGKIINAQKGSFNDITFKRFLVAKHPNEDVSFNKGPLWPYILLKESHTGREELSHEMAIFTNYPIDFLPKHLSLDDKFNGGKIGGLNKLPMEIKVKGLTVHISQLSDKDKAVKIVIDKDHSSQFKSGPGSDPETVVPENESISPSSSIDSKQIVSQDTTRDPAEETANDRQTLLDTKPFPPNDVPVGDIGVVPLIIDTATNGLECFGSTRVHALRQFFDYFLECQHGIYTLQRCPKYAMFWRSLECCVLVNKFPCKSNCLN